jgi:hypothetical protein
MFLFVALGIRLTAVREGVFHFLKHCRKGKFRIMSNFSGQEQGQYRWNRENALRKAFSLCPLHFLLMMFSCYFVRGDADPCFSYLSKHFKYKFETNLLSV